MSDAFRTYAIDSPRVVRRVVKELTEKITDDQINLAGGMAQTWDDYKYRCGLIAGYKAAIALMEEIIKENA